MKKLMQALSNKRLGRYGPAAIIAGLALLPISNTHAIPFTSDISIMGETDFDEGFALGTTSGTFDLTSGTSTTTSTYSGATVTGADPLAGSLTDIGDGFGFDGIARVTDDEFKIGFDTSLDVSNNSATDSYEVVFGLDFDNMVNADGSDAFADSELTLDIDFIEAFFSDLLSDTMFGDEVGGDPTDPATFGASLMDSAIGRLFTLTLNPGDTIDMLLSWTLKGEDFDGGLAEADLSAFLYVDSVSNITSPPPPPPPSGVPEAGTLFLFSAGLIGLLAQRRRRLKV